MNGSLGYNKSFQKFVHDSNEHIRSLSVEPKLLQNLKSSTNFKNKVSRNFNKQVSSSPSMPKMKKGTKKENMERKSSDKKIGSLILENNSINDDFKNNKRMNDIRNDNY